MAIDTAAKRRSAGGVPFLPLGPGVTPNASKQIAWRQQAAWGYSGISTAEAEVASEGEISRAGCNPLIATARLNRLIAAVPFTPLIATARRF